MTKSAFDKIAAGLSAAIDYAKGPADIGEYRVHIPASVDVRAIRKARGLTQEVFAARYGFKLGRIRDWEQNRSMPDAPSRLLLKVIENEPEALDRAVMRDRTAR